MVSEILVKNRKLLTLIIHGTEVLLYTNEIYPTLYLLLYGSNRTGQIFLWIINCNNTVKEINTYSDTSFFIFILKQWKRHHTQQSCKM